MRPQVRLPCALLRRLRQAVGGGAIDGGVIPCAVCAAHTHSAASARATSTATGTANGTTTCTADNATDERHSNERDANDCRADDVG